MDIYQKVGALLAAANGATGAGDSDLTSAIRTLIAGYVDNSLNLDDVVEWYKTEVSDAYRYVKSLGSGWVHHLVLADAHYYHDGEGQKNFRHSAAIVYALQNTGRFGKVFMLGDNADMNYEDILELIEEDYGALNGDVCIIPGNHDSAEISRTAYAGMMSEDTDIVYGSESELYFYYDDDVHKIRYVFINSRATNKDAQITWFDGLCSSLPAGYGLIAFAHHAFIMPIDMYGNERTATDGTTINSHYIDKFINMRMLDAESVIGCGHGHYHWPDWTSRFGVQQIGMTSDANYPEQYHIAGTNTEQSINILSINTETHTMKIKIIGWVSNEYYREGTFSYAAPLTNWVLGYYLPASGVPTIYESGDSAVWPNIIPLVAGSTDSFWIWDDRFQVNWYQADWRKNGNSFNARSAANGNVHARGILELAKTGSGQKASNGIVIGARITGSTDVTEWEHIHWSTTPPQFTGWNDIEWLEGYNLTNSKYTEASGYAIINKYVSVTPGQTVSFSVNDANWTTNRIYFYFNKTPRAINNGWYTTRKGVTDGSTSYSCVVPSGCYYLLIDAQNLAGYTDKAVVTITDPVSD